MKAKSQENKTKNQAADTSVRLFVKEHTRKNAKTGSLRVYAAHKNNTWNGQINREDHPLVDRLAELALKCRLNPRVVKGCLVAAGQDVNLRIQAYRFL